jgi:hypothetical protein
LCWKSVTDSCSWHTLAHENFDHCMLLMFGANGKIGSAINSAVRLLSCGWRLEFYSKAASSYLYQQAREAVIPIQKKD